MPSVAVKLYSVFFKLLLKHRLQNRIQATPHESDPFGVTSRPEESIAAANASFTDGVATKDIHIDPSTSLSIRIFLPESALKPPDAESQPRPRIRQSNPQPKHTSDAADPASRRHSYNIPNTNQSSITDPYRASFSRRNSFGSNAHKNGNQGIGSSYEADSLNMTRPMNGGGLAYRGYTPLIMNAKKLPVILQFHGGGWVSGSNDSVANDLFCRRMAKLLDVIVVGVGYRLAPENRYPAAFEDGLKVLNWLAKQANLAECNKSMGSSRVGGTEFKKSHIVDTLGASMVEPWLAAHGDPSRCVLLGVSCGANIADYVARTAVESGNLLDPVKVVAQVLMYPFFMGSIPTHSEIRLANSYFFDKAMCLLLWELFLPKEEFSLDHPVANPLVPGRAGPPLKFMPPTLTVVAEHDWMRDRAIAYSEELRKVNVDAPVYDYKDAVHEFATLDVLLKTPQAQACAEDIAIWVKKHISLRGHEFSY
ncbi:hypothetical protein SAY86_009895 [Trapa natans]|uniref:Alpha/beta hydrolase fold-3 domain-containing protein n=1 Tax=Trapa natans TaxID=22666 RepID=A0AAN7KXP7_TRANT|nr:hypothetical protein SAY86_009895 [Trapa natans]